MTAILIALALLVLLAIVLGIVIVKWLFIIAVVAALIWLIMFFTGRTRANL